MAEIYDSLDIRILFSGQADHEVYLQHRATQAQGLLNCLHDVGIGDVLVHHVPHPLAAGLWCKRDRTIPWRHQISQLHGGRIHTEGRKTNLGVRQALRNAFQDGLQPRVVGGRERTERDFLKTCVWYASDRFVHYSFRASLAYRPVPETSLAESAPA